MSTSSHLSRDLMDYWFNELINKRYSNLEASKQRVKQDIRSGYLEYMRVMADRRTRLITAKAQLIGNSARAIANVEEMQTVTKELDSVINNMAVAVQMVCSVGKLIKPVVSAGSAIFKVANKKVLVRESLKYWPSVNHFKAVGENVFNKQEVRQTLLHLGTEVAKESGKESIKRLINDLTHFLEPSYWAKQIVGENPEQEFSKRQQQIENSRIHSERIVNERITELDHKITHARKEMEELLIYIDGCRAGR